MNKVLYTLMAREALARRMAVSDDKVLEYNKFAATVTYDWDLEIDNSGPKPDADILAAIQSI